MVLRLVIDTDTGSDDAVALMLALHQPDVRVEAVTTVAGNVPLHLATRNALATLALMGSRAPVHAGHAGPLLRPLQTAQHVHGEDDMSGAPVPRALAGPAGDDAVSVLVEAARRSPGELTLVTLGPLTNVAAALLRDPATLSRYRGVFCMAGSPEGWGNITAGAEFNAWCDPEALRIVLRSGTPVTLIGWNVSREHAVVGPAELAELTALGTARSTYTVLVNRAVAHWAEHVTGLAGWDLPDPVAMAVALAPDLVSRRETVHVEVSCADETRGMLVVDRRHVAAPANAHVVWDVDGEAYRRMLVAMCADPADPAHYLDEVRAGTAAS